MIAAAGEPYHDWHRPIRLLPRAPDIDVKTVLGALNFFVDELWAHGPIMTAVPHAFPSRCRLRRLPSQLADRRLSVGNALEREGLAFNDAADRALLSAGNI